MKAPWRAMGPVWGTLLITVLITALIWLLGASAVEIVCFAAGGVFWAIIHSFGSRSD